jgi:hypothetical protein
MLEQLDQQTQVVVEVVVVMEIVPANVLELVVKEL